MSTPRLRILQRFLLAALVAAIATGATAPAHADPLPGRDRLKFQQLPMDALKYPVGDPIGGFVDRTFWGHDELSTAYGGPTPGGPGPIYVGTFMADDFADKINTPVVHVKWWGSYPVKNPDFPVTKFLISFESDVPAPAGGGFSRPGTPLLNQIVTLGPLAPGSGTYTEKPISPGGPPLFEELYEYNAELHLNKPFPEQPDTVYWLKIVALVDAPGVVVAPGQPPPPGITQWGWHNRDYTVEDLLASTPPAVSPGEHLDFFVPGTPGVRGYHFQDDAVTGGVVIDPFGIVMPGGQTMPSVVQDPLLMRPTHYVDLADGPPGISQFSKDLAFELYTVPEPATCLLALAALSLVAVERHKRQ